MNKVKKSLKIELSPNEINDFRWFLESCLQIPREIRSYNDNCVVLDNNSNGTIGHHKILSLPLAVISEFALKVLPKLFFINTSKKSLKIPLKASEALAIGYVIQNRPVQYIDNDSSFVNIQSIWLLQVGKQL